MKFRQGFVSNSSSVSFIVINSTNGLITNIDTIPYIKNNTLIVNYNFGETQYGWGPKTIYGWQSMIIFSYLQTQYVEGDKTEIWLEMLENVIKSVLDVNNIKWYVSTDYKPEHDAYIDHQSSASEGANIEMFENEEILKSFIFGKDSCICLDNDNH